MKGSRYNMSKKSARSKGYRTYKTEQKGFSKGELKTLIIAAVVLVALFITQGFHKYHPARRH